MDHSILFHEKQRFRQWWIILILLGLNAVIVYAVIQQMMFGKPFGDQPVSDIGLWWILGFLLLMTTVFFITTLETKIKKDGLYIRFFPIHMKFRYLPWTRLSQCYVRSYSPIREYGGWGWRIGLSGRAYNVSGKEGLQLQLDGKRKLLIGTQKPVEIESLLKEIGQWKEE